MPWEKNGIKDRKRQEGYNYGFWIMVWDNWSTGLNMQNPRLHHDSQGNNWWPCAADASLADLARAYKLQAQFGNNWQIIFS